MFSGGKNKKADSKEIKINKLDMPSFTKEKSVVEPVETENINTVENNKDIDTLKPGFEKRKFVGGKIKIIKYEGKEYKTNDEITIPKAKFKSLENMGCKFE